MIKFKGKAGRCPLSPGKRLVQKQKLLLGAANQTALGDGVDVVDDHLELGLTAFGLATLLDLLAMEVDQFLGEGQVANFQDTDGAVVVTSGQHLAGVEAGGSEGDIQDTGLNGTDFATGVLLRADGSTLLLSSENAGLFLP